MEIDEMIRQVEESIFSFDVPNISVQLTDLMGAIVERQLIDVNNMEQLQIFNQLMRVSLEALQNRDYLLLADIVEYRLKTMLNTGYKN